MENAVFWNGENNEQSDGEKSIPRPSSARDDTIAIYDALSMLVQELRRSNNATSPQWHPNHACSPDQTLARSPGNLRTQPSSEQSDERQKKKRRLTSSVSVPGEIHFDDADLKDISSTLPRAALLHAIIQAYFVHVQPWIPILHPGRFRRRMSKDSLLAPQLGLILHAMVVVALRYVDDEAILPSPAEADAFIARSRNIVVLTAMDSLSVENLQALTIVAFDDVSNNHLHLLSPIA